MKYYGYVLIDHTINLRTQEYIDTEDPGFFGRHRDVIMGVWKFDSEDPLTVDPMLKAIARMQLPARTVNEFCKSINFDLAGFKQRIRAESGPAPSPFSSPDNPGEAP